MNQISCNGFLNGKHCSYPGILLYENMPYCIKHYKIVREKGDKMSQKNRNIVLVDEIKHRISDLDNIDDLNIIKNLVGVQRKYLAQKNAFGLVKGDKVKITGSSKIEEGTIEKINRTRAVVMVGNTGWNVPFEMIRKISNE